MMALHMGASPGCPLRQHGMRRIRGRRGHADAQGGRSVRRPDSTQSRSENAPGLRAGGRVRTTTSFWQGEPTARSRSAAGARSATGTSAGSAVDLRRIGAGSAGTSATAPSCDWKQSEQSPGAEQSRPACSQAWSASAHAQCAEARTPAAVHRNRARQARSWKRSPRTGLKVASGRQKSSWLSPPGDKRQNFGALRTVCGQVIAQLC